MFVTHLLSTSVTGIQVSLTMRFQHFCESLGVLFSFIYRGWAVWLPSASEHSPPASEVALFCNS